MPVSSALAICNSSNCKFEEGARATFNQYTEITKEAIFDVDSDFSDEIVTGGTFFDGNRSNSQLTV